MMDFFYGLYHDMLSGLRIIFCKHFDMTESIHLLSNYQVKTDLFAEYWHNEFDRVCRSCFGPKQLNVRSVLFRQPVNHVHTMNNRFFFLSRKPIFSSFSFSSLHWHSCLCMQGNSVPYKMPSKKVFRFNMTQFIAASYQRCGLYCWWAFDWWTFACDLALYT